VELGLLLDMAAGDAPDRVAVTEVGGRGLTRAELQRAAGAAAARFADRGAARVGYLGTNGCALPVALFGAALAGIPFVPFNYRLADDQLGDLLHREDGLLLVASAATAGRARDLGVGDVVDAGSLLDGADAEAPPVAVDPDEVAVLLYTSGTTSAPKAAVLRHRHLTSYVIGTVEFGAAAENDAALVSVPPYHVAGVSTILTNLYGGRRVVYLDPFDPRAWLDAVAAEGITHAMVVPTMLARIVDELGDAPADAPSLRSLAYGGAKMPQTVIERALRAFPDVAFANAYGLTETSSTITVLGPDDHRAALAGDAAARVRLSSAGRPVPGIELRVVDDEGEPVGPGVVGDVLVRGDQVSGEYVGASAVDADGWFPTRDRGWLDEEGYLFIEGRADDTIIRGGENIAPAEIEDVLLRHPAVAECAVVGVADPEWGQRIAAAVVPRSGERPDTEELREWVRRHLRSSKTPDVVTLCDALPYTDTGKLLRRAVRARFETPVA
jgi:acyl-CoA synthetase (AMP-forming)/AMP-acid ligase II